MKNTIDHNSRHHAEGHAHTSFDNPEKFAGLFDSSERDEWQKPDEVIRSFKLPNDAVAVDIGAGTGYFTIRLAQYLKNGRVIALDEAPKMVAHLKKRVEELEFTNVDVRLSEQGRNIYLHEKADLMTCIDAYHHIAERTAYFSHLKQYINQGGKLVIIDRAVSSPVGPPSALRTPPELVKKEMERAGFELIQALDILLPYQFYLAFKPRASSGLKTDARPINRSKYPK